MRHKKMLIIVCSVLFAIILTGCSNNGKSEKEIASDLSDSDYLPVDGLVISDIDVFQRRTDTKDGTDLVYVKASGKAGSIEYQFSYLLNYLYFDKGGWILQSAEPYQMEEWSIDSVDETIVQKDVVENDHGILYGVTITDFARLLDNISPQTGVCEETVRLKGQGEGFHCDVTVVAGYVLTSEGWKYNYHYYQDKTVYPEYSVSTGESEAYVEQVYGLPATEISVDTNWEYGRETHYVVTSERFPYLTIETMVETEYRFDEDLLCWVINTNYTNGANYLWDVIGTWQAEGNAESDILYPNGFPYRVKCVVSQENEQTYRVDYEYLNPIVPWTSYYGKQENEIGTGTVYVNVNDTYCKTKNGIWDITPEWRILVDLPGTSDQLLFSAVTGVQITHFSWGSYTKELVRTN